ncbi:MAG: membrane protein insertase YidC [Desulfobacterales bacterium]|nr:membrane protein insertase YidC [Desulfobacterales bacterium]
MEKRTILAFILSFLVLILWSFLFTPKEEQAPVQDKDVISEAPELTQPVPSPVLEKTISKVIPKADSKEIVIDTPFYRAIFTNEGPTIKSFQLKNYHESADPDSPLIELVSLEKGMGDFLHMDFETPSLPQKENQIYQIDHEDIHLGPESSPEALVFRSSASNGISMNQAFSFYPDQYRIVLDIDIFNQSEEPVKGVPSATLMALPPSKKKGYYSYVGFAALLNNELEEIEIDVSEENITRGKIDWIAYEDDYFISAIVPQEPSKAVFQGRLLAAGTLEGTHLGPLISIPPYQQVSLHYDLYFGPRDLKLLKQFGKGLDRAVDFGWTDFIARPLLYILRFFNQYINNYGVSIILLTILVKIIFWPLTHKSYKSMKEMKKLQPRMAKIREKYKGNKQQMNKEMMSLYKTYKVNPMSGCLPMLIQIPVFFALFRVLGSAIELRHAPFMLWMNDLSAPDRLFNFPFSIPFMEPPYGIPVLTLLMGASMFIQQKMTPTPGDPAQAKIMMFLPIIFTVMFINFPSGLVLYWLINNVLSIGQQYNILKKPA